MKNSNLKQIFLFTLVFMLIFSLGGCGGGGSSLNSSDDEVFSGVSNDDPEILRILDKILSPDEYGVPYIFNYAPLPENLVNTQNTSGTPINYSAYIFPNEQNGNGEFITSFDLEKGNDYIIKYSRAGRTLDGLHLDLRITAPENQIMILDFMGGHVKTSTDIDFESRDIISKSIYVDTECEFIPEENPCIMLYSFKAPLTGKYEFAIKEANSYINSGDVDDEGLNNELPFEFKLYTPGEAFSHVDEEDKKLTARQVLDIQRILLDYADEIDEYGLPTTFDEYGGGRSTVSSAANTSRYVSRYNYRNKIYDILSLLAIPPKVIIKPKIEVPYDNTFELGAGIYAHSGLRSITRTAIYDNVFSKSALETFSIGQTGTPTIENLSISNISTEEEFLRVKRLDGGNSLTLLKDAFSEESNVSARLGLAGTKTLILRYELKEDSARMPQMKDIKMMDGAVQILKRYYDIFRREFGDYFVAGYTYGLFYEIVIDINAKLFDCSYSVGHDTHPKATVSVNSLGDAEAIVEEISKKIQDAFVMNSADIITRLESNLSKSTNVTISFSNLNASGVSEGIKISSLSELMKNLNDFKAKAKQTSSSQYQRLYATLISYREIEDIKKYIPEALPITKKHYDMIKDLNKAVYLTSCYKNALDSIPNDHLIGGQDKHTEWTSEYDNLRNRFQNRLNHLCSDINLVNDDLGRFNALLKKYRELNHRYVFYRKMVAEQSRYRLHTRDAKWVNSDYYWNYPWFEYGFRRDSDVAINATVAKDLQDSKSIKNREIYGIAEWMESFVDWERLQRYTFDKGARIYWYQGGPIKTNESYGWDNKGTSFGKKSYDWEFERSRTWGKSRRIEFKVEFKIISMPDDKYPFVGLVD